VFGATGIVPFPLTIFTHAVGSAQVMGTSAALLIRDKLEKIVAFTQKIPPVRFQHAAAAIVVVSSFCWIGWTRSGLTSNGPTTTATAFMDDLAAGRFEAAYARTSAAFQTCNSLEVFSRTLEPLEACQAADTCGAEAGRTTSVSPSSDTSDPSTFQVCISEGGKSLVLKMLVEQSEWKVSSCILQTGQAQEGRPADDQER
jgi:hypothetical protein